MDTTNNPDLVKAWIDYHHQLDNSLEKESLCWAELKLSHMAYEDPEQCLDVILKILLKDTSDVVMANLAAGPLEDLLVDHGTKMIEKVELLANQNSAFKKLLGGVWQNDMPSEIWDRVSALADKRW